MGSSFKLGRCNDYMCKTMMTWREKYMWHQLRSSMITFIFMILLGLFSYWNQFFLSLKPF